MVGLRFLRRGQWCGSVGRAVASESRGPRFESSHRQKFNYLLNICLLSTVYWKDENKKKRGREWPILKKKIFKEKTISLVHWEHVNLPFKGLKGRAVAWSSGYGWRLLFKRLWVRIYSQIGFTNWSNLDFLVRWSEAGLQNSHWIDHFREGGLIEGASVIAALQRLVQGEVAFDDAGAKSNGTQRHQEVLLVAGVADL